VGRLVYVSKVIGTSLCGYDATVYASFVGKPERGSKTLGGGYYKFITFLF
jgi:hypothetical protein